MTGSAKSGAHPLKLRSHPDCATDFTRRANHFVFSEMACPAPFAKIFLFRPDPNQFTDSHRPVPQRGVAHVINVGHGMRWTRRHWARMSDCRAGFPVSGHRRAGRKMLKRTAKSCGSDAPRLASSFAEASRPNRALDKTISAGRRWQNSMVTEESTKEAVKTIARGMPGDSGVTVVTMLVCFFYFAREAAGASSARHSLRPLNWGQRIHAQLGRIAPRDCGSAFARHSGARRSTTAS